ncbi:MAG: SDR family oxidoreductase [Anaerolineae bacterium]|nr:SDR family oxidoreductase [Anaerolineae bacterium]MDW8100997.1 SDR family oxidoreductase [Anaerolineae bacterium]
MANGLEGKWALILGASSGFGAATALELARAGMNIFGVHLDRKATMPNVERIVGEIESMGRRAVFFNQNAADPEARAQALDRMQAVLNETNPPQPIHLMMHSLAFGSLLPFIADSPKEVISQKQMEMTLDVMAHSLVYWVQDLFWRGMLARGSRVFSMTSAGSYRAFKTYGAVSAAKAALEAHTRQLALELGPYGILVNCIEAGVTDTPALRKIPGHEEMIAEAMRRNPMGRMTTPQDIANTIRALADPSVAWITGAVIRVDGGESIVA